jgi:hypothetical protein
MRINLSLIGQIALGVYLNVIGIAHFLELSIASWFLPLAALIAGAAILIGVTKGIVFTQKSDS